MAATTKTAATIATSTKDDSSYKPIVDAYKYRAENAINETLRDKIAAASGYSAADMARIPKDANLGECCGNPLAIAGLKEVSHV